jgi:hypothetical protein
LGQLVFNGPGVSVGSGSASRLTIAFRPVPLGFGIAIAMRPANWQDGFDLGHNFSAHHKLAGISALGQMRGTACARDWNKMWAALQAPSNCQTCWMGSQILCECFERINLSDIIPKIWFGKPWGVFAKISVSKGCGVGDFLGENTAAHGRKRHKGHIELGTGLQHAKFRVAGPERIFTLYRVYRSDRTGPPQGCRRYFLKPDTTNFTLGLKAQKRVHNLFNLNIRRAPVNINTKPPDPLVTG